MWQLVSFSGLSVIGAQTADRGPSLSAMRASSRARTPLTASLKTRKL